jgi:Uma2 family endonuclease
MAAPRMPPPPPLETGDHLTRGEFERRYDAMPLVNKAELIEGVVFMPSPVRLQHHGKPHADFFGWLVMYRAGTVGVSVGDNSTVRLDLENEPQPDALAIVEPEFGGQVVISPDDYIEGSPDLVGEIASSTASFDLHTKLRVYRRNRVQEYLVWRVLDKAIDWFALHGTDYDRLPLGSDGILRSEVFPGLWLDPSAMIRSDLARVLEVLQQGLASPEHTAFVAKLQAQSRKP